MSMINMNIICFIIILVSTSLFSVATAIDGYIFESNAAFFHKLLLTNDTSKTDEFSFTFSKDSNCEAKRLQVSFGSAQFGSSLISFKFYIMDISGQVVATVASMDHSSIVPSIGNKFVVTFKSLGPIKLQTIGKVVQSSNTNIREEFSFDKFNSTHLGITFYAWFTDTNTQECSFHFDFPDYDVLKGNTNLPTTVVPPHTLPSGKSTQQPMETANIVLPEKSTSPSEKTTTPSEKTSTSSENISINLTVIFVIFGVVTFVMGILISAVTYFVFSKFSYSKSPEDDNTKPDAEETKATTFQYNIRNYFPNITRISNRQKLSKFKANDFNASAFGTALKSTITSATQK